MLKKEHREQVRRLYPIRDSDTDAIAINALLDDIDELRELHRRHGDALEHALEQGRTCECATCLKCERDIMELLEC